MKCREREGGVNPFKGEMDVGGKGRREGDS